MGLVTLLVIPVAFLLIGGVGKKVVRGKGWRRRDFYLGVDAVLASLSAALIHVSDLFAASREAHPSGPAPGGVAGGPMGEMLNTLVFIVGSILLYLLLLGIHQDWEPRSRNTFGQRFWLLVVSNVAGLGSLLVFVYVLKGVR